MNETRSARTTTTKGTSPAAQAEPGTRSMPLAAALAMILPGLGHWYLGQRHRAIIFFITVSATFWTGVAVGGVRSTVHATENGAWFAAQLCIGSQALVAWVAGSQIARLYPNDVQHTAYWPSENISVVYAGIAGLLNLLIVIDALARCEHVDQSNRAPPGARS